MFLFVGIPLFGGMGAFLAFWYFATYKNVEFSPVLVAASTIAILAVGLFGITYSVMSTSWDPDVEGSFLGTEEFSNNIENIKDGLTRARKNMILREKMNGMAEEEIQAAVADMDKKDEMIINDKKIKIKDEVDRKMKLCMVLVQSFLGCI